MLDLSNSLFSGSIFHFFCDRTDELKELTILYLGYNYLTGEIPDCWINWENLIVVDLHSNHLTGNIPSSIGDLIFLQELLLDNNHLSGELPLSLQKCKNLLLVSLAKNNFIGSIPTWIGKSLSQLMVLIFYSNKLHGDIPNELCNLLSLQILDPSLNNFVGAIPICFGKFRAMSSAKFESRGSSFFFRFKHGFFGKYIDNDMLVKESKIFGMRPITPILPRYLGSFIQQFIWGDTIGIDQPHRLDILELITKSFDWKNPVEDW